MDFVFVGVANTFGPDKEGFGGGGGDVGAFEPGKLIAPKASVSPAKACSGCVAGGDDM